MNTPPNNAATAGTRPVYWSVRRELWENRSTYFGPLAVAAVFLFGFAISAFYLQARISAALASDPSRLHRMVTSPYHAASGLILLTAFLVGAFYCLEALSSERRDRSILFWKSLPVSDRTTVLSKAAIPLVILPLLVFAIIVVTHLIMLVLSSAVLVMSGGNPGTMWSRLPLLHMWVAHFYALTVIALWHAPIYAWLLLVSGWARRAAFLWAVLPLIAIPVFEGIAFRTTHFLALLKYFFIGWLTQAFASHAPNGALHDPLTKLAPGKFLTTPSLWIGLVLAALFLAAAVQLRRNREPN